MKTIITTILILFTQFFGHSEVNFDLNYFIKLTEERIYQQNYNLTIDFIKKHEGFAGGKVYICPGGHKTIGYGHLIRPGEQFTTLTKMEADSLLKSDFNKAIKLTEKSVNLSGNKKLAIAHFIFTRGIGTFEKSTLKKRIEKNMPIESELIRYCMYRNNEGNLVFSSNYMKMRMFEIKMYYL